MILVKLHIVSHHTPKYPKLSLFHLPHKNCSIFVTNCSLIVRFYNFFWEKITPELALTFLILSSFPHCVVDFFAFFDRLRIVRTFMSSCDLLNMNKPFFLIVIVSQSPFCECFRCLNSI